MVYEDDDLIVIDKPAGLVVHPAAGHATGTLVNALIAHCGDSLSGIGGVKRPGIVHRLDKDTTGLHGGGQDRPRPPGAGRPVRRPWPHRAAGARLSAPSSGARRAAARAPSTRRSTATRKHRDRMAGCARGDGARGHHPLAVLETRSPAADGKPVASLIDCRLETGRTHQIRVHMAHVGHPLLGDADLWHRASGPRRPGCPRTPRAR